MNVWCVCVCVWACCVVCVRVCVCLGTLCGVCVLCTVRICVYMLCLCCLLSMCGIVDATGQCSVSVCPKRLPVERKMNSARVLCTGSLCLHDVGCLLHHISQAKSPRKPYKWLNILLHISLMHCSGSEWEGKGGWGEGEARRVWGWG